MNDLETRRLLDELRGRVAACEAVIETIQQDIKELNTARGAARGAAQLEHDQVRAHFHQLNLALAKVDASLARLEARLDDNQPVVNKMRRLLWAGGLAAATAGLALTIFGADIRCLAGVWFRNTHGIQECLPREEPGP